MGISGTTIFDDVYLMAGTGDEFLGDCTVATLLPTGNGFVNQFVGSDGNSTDNYLLVDEQPPSSTDYVGSATTGQQDLYTLTNLTGSGTVLAVAPTIYAVRARAYRLGSPDPERAGDCQDDPADQQQTGDGCHLGRHAGLRTPRVRSR